MKYKTQVIASKEDDDELEAVNSEPYLNYFEEHYNSTLVKFYLDEVIKSPKYYRPLIHRLGTLSQHDQVQVIVNTYGGSFDGIVALINAVQNTPAEVYCEIEGKACSAGSIFALACPNLSVGKYSSMMIHPSSFGSSGFQGNVIAHSTFIDNEVKRLYKDVYADFLTEKELEDVFLGKEFWFDYEEITRRLELRTEIQEKKLKKLAKEAKTAGK